ncbi:hypothetical protein XCCB100_4228 [Xanthomonas campestris pv. campestris]|uniref:Uncharacterized protein n=1 Tax=Xanthomonas campestris pv. campestris (strain B100) TaxID=509169 RepID=B0RYR1_XANCB|nr:hypothetical protein XCCB100_4228 [Xanthomonas campestris pv. campestris]
MRGEATCSGWSARGFARTLIRPCGAPSPDGRREHLQPTRTQLRIQTRADPPGVLGHYTSADYIPSPAGEG